MISAGTHGAPHWVDLAATDVTAAAAFYADLLGWEITTTSSPLGDYHLARVGERQVAGMMAAPDPEATSSTWTTFVYVEDVDDTARMAGEADGSVLEAPFDIPGGRVAVVSDPTGAMFGVITGPAPEGTWLSRDPGAVCWVELLTRDVPAAEAFYGQMFGWKAETRMYGPTAYTTFSLDGEPVAGMMAMPAGVPAEAPSHWMVAFAVADCGQAARKAAGLGGSVLVPSRAIGHGHFAVVQDAQGAVFELLDDTT